MDSVKMVPLLTDRHAPTTPPCAKEEAGAVAAEQARWLAPWSELEMMDVGTLHVV